MFMKALHILQGFLHTGCTMNVIYECAAKFITLENYEYRFVVSKNRKTWELKLNFCDSDFSTWQDYNILPTSVFLRIEKTHSKI